MTNVCPHRLDNDFSCIEYTGALKQGRYSGKKGFPLCSFL